MKSKLSKISPRTNALVVGVTMLALMMFQSVSAGTVNPADQGYNNLEMLTFFTFFVGYIAMGAAFVFFIVERNNVAPQFRTTMTISALIVGIAANSDDHMGVLSALADAIEDEEDAKKLWKETSVENIFNLLSKSL